MLPDWLSVCAEEATLVSALCWLMSALLLSASGLTSAGVLLLLPWKAGVEETAGEAVNDGAPLAGVDDDPPAPAARFCGMAFSVPP